MARFPAVRIANARDMLSFLEKFQVGARQAVFARMPLASIEALDAGARTGWLPLEHDHFIVDGIVSVLGVDGSVECWRASVPEMIDKPLLRSFVSGMLRLFDHDRRRIVGMFPKGWALVYQDFCDIELVESNDSHAVLAFTDIAPVLQDYPNYFHAFHGVVQGFCDFAELSGVSFNVAPDSRSARAQLRFRQAELPALRAAGRK
jgi:hypothetical protein